MSYRGFPIDEFREKHGLSIKRGNRVKWLGHPAIVLRAKSADVVELRVTGVGRVDAKANEISATPLPPGEREFQRWLREQVTKAFDDRARRRAER